MAEATPDLNTATTDGQTATTTGGNTSGDTSAAGAEFKPITSQEDLNRALNERLTRERAKFADYNDLKAKATQFDAIAEAQKTELQRIQERADAAEKRAQALEAKQQIADWKSEIAKDPAFAGVPAGVLRGTTQEELIAHAAELKALLPDPNASSVRHGAFIAGEGRTTTAVPSPAQEFAEIIQNARGRAR